MAKSRKTPKKISLTTEQWNELVDFIADFVADQGVVRLQVAAGLIGFGSKFSLPAMYRFLQYAKREGMSKSETCATLVHDLNGRNQDPEIFSPRTSSY